MQKKENLWCVLFRFISYIYIYNKLRNYECKSMWSKTTNHYTYEEIDNCNETSIAKDCCH